MNVTDLLRHCAYTIVHDRSAERSGYACFVVTAYRGGDYTITPYVFTDWAFEKLRSILSARDGGRVIGILSPQGVIMASRADWSGATVTFSNDPIEVSGFKLYKTGKWIHLILPDSTVFVGVFGYNPTVTLPGTFFQKCADLYHDFYANRRVFSPQEK